MICRRVSLDLFFNILTNFEEKSILVGRIEMPKKKFILTPVTLKFGTTSTVGHFPNNFTWATEIPMQHRRHAKNEFFIYL
jgi:hypothetical protein